MSVTVLKPARTALITGGAGFVGRHLYGLLRDHGWRVVTYDLVDGDDIRDYERLRACIDRVQPDAIWHLAAQAYVPEAGTDPRRGIDVNVLGTLNLLEAVRHTGSRARIMLAGTSEEYGYETQDADTITEQSPARPTSVYGVTKLAAGQLGLTYARTYSMPVVVTRAWNHTGPGHPPTYAVPSWARQIARVEAGVQDVVRYGNLDARRSYLDVRDVVEAYRLAIDLDPGVYNVAGDRVVTMREVLDLLVGIARVPVPLEQDPGLYRPGVAQGSARFPTPDASRLVDACGWKPQVPLEQTLADVLDYWRSVA